VQIAGSVVLVTGANRGIGAEFVRQLKARGALKVYGAARNVDALRADGVVPVRLDVTDEADIAAAAATASDVRFVINNAGVASGASLMESDLAVIRAEFETNFFGPLRVARAFAPILKANGGGALLNVLSASSWLSTPGATTYAASKAAAWSMTDGLRVELAQQGTEVVSLHMGPVDTDMIAGFDVPKSTPAEIVAAALDGIEARATEVLADAPARRVKTSLTLTPSERYAAFLAKDDS
jgi:NAD(P)-dependent dehydrogenase (short-subunit alcohol dehydrogenase family)